VYTLTYYAGNDIELAESPLSEYIPGQPWPPVRSITLYLVCITLTLSLSHTQNYVILSHNSDVRLAGESG
jgi:hypothetical protein